MIEEKQNKIVRKGERGNVLFLILIAVALFAALSYAVTQSTRSGGGDAGRETSRISSAQLTQYPAGIRTSLVRMIIGGQNVDTLEFNSAGTPGAGAEWGGCLEYPGGSGEYPRCVFHPTGGGATYMSPSSDLVAAATGWVFNGENEINLIGTTTAGDAVGTGTADLIAFLPNITLSVCEAINDELGITAIPEESGIDIETQMINAVGTTAGETSLGAGGATIGSPTGTDVTELDGQPFGCFQQPAGTYVYYHVLIER